MITSFLRRLFLVSFVVRFIRVRIACSEWNHQSCFFVLVQDVLSRFEDFMFVSCTRRLVGMRSLEVLWFLTVTVANCFY